MAAGYGFEEDVEMMDTRDTAAWAGQTHAFDAQEAAGMEPFSITEEEMGQGREDHDDSDSDNREWEPRETKSRRAVTTAEAAPASEAGFFQLKGNKKMHDRMDSVFAGLNAPSHGVKGDAALYQQLTAAAEERDEAADDHAWEYEMMNRGAITGGKHREDSTQTMHDPSKWTRYSLETENGDDGSNQTNAQIAMQFHMTHPGAGEPVEEPVADAPLNVAFGKRVDASDAVLARPADAHIPLTYLEEDTEASAGASGAAGAAVVPPTQSRDVEDDEQGEQGAQAVAMRTPGKSGRKNFRVRTQIN